MVMNPETLKAMKELTERLRHSKWPAAQEIELALYDDCLQMGEAAPFMGFTEPAGKFIALLSPANVSALIAEYERVVEVLDDANSLCRSALAVAQSEGLQTNWTAFTSQLVESLKRQHEVMYPATDLAQQQRK